MMTMKFIFLIAAFYNASLGQCNDEYDYGHDSYSCKRAGIVRKIDGSHHQLRGNSNTEIGHVELCHRAVQNYIDMNENRGENSNFDKRENEYEGYIFVDHAIGESVWFYGTNLPPNCYDSDDEPRCNIILSDSPSCHDEDVFQKSKTIRQMHYITDPEGNAGHPLEEWIKEEGVNTTLLEYDFPGLPGLVSRTASVHFTDQTGKRVACAIVESEEDSKKLLDHEYDLMVIHDMSKKVVGASLVLEGRDSRYEGDTSEFVMSQVHNWGDPLNFHLLPE